MKKKIIFPVLFFSLFMLNACSTNEIKIEKVTSNYEEESKDEEEIQIYTENMENSEPPEISAIGEKIFAERLVTAFGSGEIYFTINKAEVYETMQEANLELEDMYADEFLDGINWDSKTNSFVDHYVLIILDITIENVDAISSASGFEPEKYDQYDFRIDALGSCSNGTLKYFDKMNECSKHRSAFHIEPGETIKLKCGYLVDMRELDLKDILFVTSTDRDGNEYGVDLDLG